MYITTLFLYSKTNILSQNTSILFAVIGATRPACSLTWTVYGRFVSFSWGIQLSLQFVLEAQKCLCPILNFHRLTCLVVTRLMFVSLSLYKSQQVPKRFPKNYPRTENRSVDRVAMRIFISSLVVTKNTKRLDCPVGAASWPNHPVLPLAGMGPIVTMSECPGGRTDAFGAHTSATIKVTSQAPSSVRTPHR